MRGDLGGPAELLTCLVRVKFKIRITAEPKVITSIQRQEHWRFQLRPLLALAAFGYRQTHTVTMTAPVYLLNRRTDGSPRLIRLCISM